MRIEDFHALMWINENPLSFSEVFYQPGLWKAEWRKNIM